MPKLTRRQMLAGSSVALAGPALAAEPEVAAQAFPKDAAEALSRLKAGNARFAAGQTRHAHESANWRKQLVGGQKPFATILGCSDSRVPVELVFDQGFGDLFVVRVAGNVISPDVVGSLTYALVHLRTPLFVVVGHQQCGAVTAALAALAGSSKEPPGIRALVELIEPGLPKDLAGDLTEQRVNAAVEANVGWSIKQLRALPGAKATFDKQQIALLGGVYELGTGRVRFLNA